MTIRKIMHPTDFSECSARALTLAESLARDHQALLLVLHVFRPQLPAEAMLSWEDYLTALKKELETVRPADPSIRVEHLLVEGDPPKRIIELAEDQECDLIVMGTHGRGGLARLALGSVAEGVLRKAPCPVVTVRMPARPVQPG